MSSAIATCSPGSKPARSIACTSASSACSLVAKSGHQPPSSATPRSGAALLHQQAGVAVDLGRPLERLREAARAGADDHEVLDVDAAAGVRAAAEDLDLRHRQQRRLGAAEVLVQRHAARRGRRRAPRPSTPPASRWHRGGTCSACRRARSGGGRAPPGRRPTGRRAARAISPLTWPTARITSSPPKRGAAVAQLDAPRACPCDAPAGRWPGRPRRRAASPRPRRSAGRGCPRRGGARIERMSCALHESSSARQAAAIAMQDGRPDRRSSARRDAAHPRRDRPRR